MSEDRRTSQDVETFCAAYNEFGNATEAAYAAGMKLLETPPASDYYVYLLVDPRDDTVFYVGKGKGDRAYSHEREARTGHIRSNVLKAQRIEEILAVGLTVRVNIVDSHFREADAFRQEAQLIGLLSGLTNIAPGVVPEEQKIVAKAKFLLSRVKPIMAWMRERNPSQEEILLYMRTVLELKRQTSLEYARRLVEVY